MRVRFSISEDEYLKFAKQKANRDHKIMQNQLPVQLVLSDGSLYDETGSISLSNRQIDPATGSLLIQASFNNGKNLLRPGQYVKLRLQTDIYQNAVLIPQQAVNQIQNIYQVFLVTDSNKIKPVVIKPGKRVGSNWIVAEGLKAGDRVAILGSAVVKPGLPVKPTNINWNYDSTSNK
jgi:membrane fusion protein (multidrug efflux system)